MVKRNSKNRREPNGKKISNVADSSQPTAARKSNGGVEGKLFIDLLWFAHAHATMSRRRLAVLLRKEMTEAFARWNSSRSALLDCIIMMLLVGDVFHFLISGSGTHNNNNKDSSFPLTTWLFVAFLFHSSLLVVNSRESWPNQPDYIFFQSSFGVLSHFSRASDRGSFRPHEPRFFSFFLSLDRYFLNF